MSAAAFDFTGLPLRADLAWQDGAACKDTWDDTWFPEKGASTRWAKRICGQCEVRSECLEYALASNEQWGVWGGLSERERRQIRRDRASGGTVAA